MQVLESPGARGAEQSMLGVTTFVHGAPASLEGRPASACPGAPPSPAPFVPGAPELLAVGAPLEPPGPVPSPLPEEPGDAPPLLDAAGPDPAGPDPASSVAVAVEPQPITRAVSPATQLTANHRTQPGTRTCGVVKPMIRASLALPTVPRADTRRLASRVTSASPVRRGSHDGVS